jgi:hypothetical protein
MSYYFYGRFDKKVITKYESTCHLSTECRPNPCWSIGQRGDCVATFVWRIGRCFRHTQNEEELVSGALRLGWIGRLDG